MKFSIQKMEKKIKIDEKNFTEYAFIDEAGYCIIIVYSEKKRDLLIKLFNKK